MPAVVGATAVEDLSLEGNRKQQKQQRKLMAVAAGPGARPDAKEQPASVATRLQNPWRPCCASSEQR